jgi:putative hydrolase of the HAD superfamily
MTTSGLVAVIFDLDCTLIDYSTFKTNAVQAAITAMRNAGLELPEETIKATVDAVYAEFGIEYELVYSTVLGRQGIDLATNAGQRILQAGITAHNRIKYAQLVPYPEVKETLEQLRALRLLLALVTDAPRHKAWERLQITGLDNEFGVVVTLDDTKKTKPHPRPFIRALEQLMVSPHDCLVVGDNPARDIRGGRRMGMLTCLAEYGLWNTDGIVEPHYRLGEFRMLPKVVSDITQDHGNMTNQLEAELRADAQASRLWRQARKRIAQCGPMQSLLRHSPRVPVGS